MKVKEKLVTQWDLVKTRSDEILNVEEPETITQDFIDNLGHKYLLNSLEVETKAIGRRGIIKGFGSTYEVDEGGDRILPGAFHDDLDKFAVNPMMLFSHQLNMILGSWTVFEEQAKGLYLEGEINLKTQLGKDTYTLIGDNDLKGLSIGYSILKRAFDDENEVLELMKLRLWEVSVVAIPMNQNAWITATKIFNGADVKEEEPEFDKVEFDKEIDDMVPHHNPDFDLNWNKLALAMCKFLGARGGFNISEEKAPHLYKHLADHYKELDKEVPDVEKEEAEFKDIEWKEDEKFILECSNLDGSLQSSINIIKYFLKTDRIKSVDRTRLAEMLNLLADIRDKDYELAEKTKKLEEINPHKAVTNTAKGEKSHNDKELDELLVICRTLKDSIGNVRKFDINDVVVSEIKIALAKATGKVIQ